MAGGSTILRGIVCALSDWGWNNFAIAKFLFVRTRICMIRRQTTCCGNLLFLNFSQYSDMKFFFILLVSGLLSSAIHGQIDREQPPVGDPQGLRINTNRLYGKLVD